MKKLFSIVAVLLCAAFTFAQAVESVGLTDSDVKNFAKNYDAINESLENLGDSAADYAAAEAILGKYGISGPNRIAKVTVIATSLTPALAEYELQKDPESAAMMKMLGIDPLAELKAVVNEAVNEKDYKVVLNNIKLFEEAVDEVDKKEESKKKAIAAQNRASLTKSDRSQMRFMGLDPEDDDDVEAFLETKKTTEKALSGGFAGTLLGMAAKEIDNSIEQDKIEKANAAKSKAASDALIAKASDKSLRKSKNDVDMLYPKYMGKKYVKGVKSETYTGNAHYSRPGLNFTYEDFCFVDNYDSILFKRVSTDEIFNSYDCTKVVWYYSPSDDCHTCELVYYTKEIGPIHLFYDSYEEEPARLSNAVLGEIEGSIFIIPQ